jgi:hypothetical protein
MSRARSSTRSALPPSSCSASRPGSHRRRGRRSMWREGAPLRRSGDRRARGNRAARVGPRPSGQPPRGGARARDARRDGPPTRPHVSGQPTDPRAQPAEAVTDELTDLGNPRRLLADLDEGLRMPGPPRLPRPVPLRSRRLQALQRCARSSRGRRHARQARTGPRHRGRALGAAYLLGGDEFCVLAELPSGSAEAVADTCRAALTERADGLEITASFGSSPLTDGRTASDVLRLADRRLYADKLQRWLDQGRRPDDVLCGKLDDPAELSGLA